MENKTPEFVVAFAEIPTLKFCKIDDKEWADASGFLKEFKGTKDLSQYKAEKKSLIKEFANMAEIKEEDLFSVLESDTSVQLINARLAISLVTWASSKYDLYGMMSFQDMLLNGVSYSSRWVKTAYEARFANEKK